MLTKKKNSSRKRKSKNLQRKQKSSSRRGKFTAQQNAPRNKYSKIDFLNDLLPVAGAAAAAALTMRAYSNHYYKNRSNQSYKLLENYFTNKFDASKEFFRLVGNLYIYRDHPKPIFHHHNPRMHLCLIHVDFDDIYPLIGMIAAMWKRSTFDETLAELQNIATVTDENYKSQNVLYLKKDASSINISDESTVVVHNIEKWDNQNHLDAIYSKLISESGFPKLFIFTSGEESQDNATSDDVECRNKHLTTQKFLDKLNNVSFNIKNKK